MMSFCEVEAVVRLNQLEALAEEIIINSQGMRVNKVPHFTVPPRCPCTTEDMKKMMSEPMNFELDGLLYYSNDGWYTPGYTPLVGWLEPWMLPEVLEIPIHESYKKTNLPIQEYVHAYNDKHNHHYVHGRPWEKKKPEECSEATAEEEDKEKIVVD